MPAMKGSNGVIHTIRGPIDAGALGYCQCHEHLFIRQGQSAKVNPALCMEDLGSAISELLIYKNAGGSSIVDAQPVGCGRMASRLLEASARTGVHIVASTGFHKLIFYPDSHWIFTLEEQALAALYTREILAGMADEDGEPALPGGCRRHHQNSA